MSPPPLASQKIFFSSSPPSPSLIPLLLLPHFFLISSSSSFLLSPLPFSPFVQSLHRHHLLPPFPHLSTFNRWQRVSVLLEDASNCHQTTDTIIFPISGLWSSIEGRYTNMTRRPSSLGTRRACSITCVKTLVLFD